MSEIITEQIFLYDALVLHYKNPDLYLDRAKHDSETNGYFQRKIRSTTIFQIVPFKNKGFVCRKGTTKKNKPLAWFKKYKIKKLIDYLDE